MSKIDPAAVSVNAAGIADALRVLQGSELNGQVRLNELTRAHEGWCGVMERVSEAGHIMEHFRVRLGVKAAWGAELPYLYDVWDLIAEALWNQLGQVPVDAIVHRAIERAVSIDAT